MHHASGDVDLPEQGRNFGAIARKAANHRKAWKQSGPQAGNCSSLDA